MMAPFHSYWSSKPEKQCLILKGGCQPCCRLLQVGLLPPEVAKEEAVKLKNARCACGEGPYPCVCNYHCRQ